ncbi:MAG: T9SS type A sorting domain-containing protein [Bacteroidales bacterium]|nr:T9SS type A sorting domain-containing protein [Bacteroidales bacterium]
MKQLKIIFSLAIILIVAGNIFAQNIVTGNAFVYGETDYSDIKVKAIRTAPTALVDSTITNLAGEFSLNLEDGIYYFEYSRTGCITLSSETSAVYDDVVVPTVILHQNGIFGNISGVLPAGDYVVTADLILHQDSSLIIEPGTRLLFYYDVKFDVYGLLTAEGTETDSIIMTSFKADEYWNGLKINEATSDSSRISFARISRSHAHGIHIYKSSIHLSNSVICNNTVTYGLYGGYVGGAGIMAKKSSSVFDKITVKNNFTNNEVGGIYVINEFERVLKITNSVIENNYSGSDYSGLYYEYGKLILENTRIAGNTTSCGPFSSAIFLESSEDIILTNVAIVDNGCLEEGFFEGSSIMIFRLWGEKTKIKLTNVTIAGSNYYNGIYICNNYDSATLEMTNCIIANQSGYAIYDDLVESNPNIITNSLFWNNLAGNINYENDWFGEILTTNSNGLECDPWYNIFVDPKFVDSLNGDYRLSQLSPCIDAGENDSVYLATDLAGLIRILDGNGDGNSIVDIGAYEFDSTLIKTPEEIFSNQELTVYPNPTQGIININLQEVSKILVYNSEGIQVDILLSRKCEIDLSHLDSGLYNLVVFTKKGVKVVRIIKV